MWKRIPQLEWYSLGTFHPNGAAFHIFHTEKIDTSYPRVFWKCTKIISDEQIKEDGMKMGVKRMRKKNKDEMF